MSQNPDQTSLQRRGTYDSGYEGGNISAQSGKSKINNP